jgi:hypothetical protein
VNFRTASTSSIVIYHIAVAKFRIRSPHVFNLSSRKDESESCRQIDCNAPIRLCVLLLNCDVCHCNGLLHHSNSVGECGQHLAWIFYSAMYKKKKKISTEKKE